MANQVKDPKLFSTPGIPSSRARVTISASTFANADAALCFRKLLDTSVWRDWNHLIPEVTIRSQPSEDVWQTPCVSRNPSTAPGAPYSSQNHQNSTMNSGPPCDSKVAQKSHLKSGDPLEDPKSESIDVPASDPLSSLVQRARNPSIPTLTEEPSVRLRLGTKMTFHVVLDPTRPGKYRKTELVVTELIRPGDHPTGDKPVYRVVWEGDTKLTFPHSLPKWLLFSQRVTEIRPIIRGDGKENCEITTWECQRGLLARFVMRYYGQYLQKMFEQNVQGLKEYCEALGGVVDRRDFSISAGM